ncbi:MAG: hypothetical protein KGI58_00590 [Patescibacteria group bacterium]|nr:hypothetical protein [Patescibacteria group bacterium]
MKNIIIIESISILGLIGFLISSYIYKKKKSKKKLICPRRSNCDTVIHSDHSKIMGIPVEVLGMTYYFIISCSYSLLLSLNIWSFSVAVVLLGATLSATLFSIYLVSIQAFVVKHWCIWCLSSAIISISIASLAYILTLAF